MNKQILLILSICFVLKSYASVNCASLAAVQGKVEILRVQSAEMLKRSARDENAPDGDKVASRYMLPGQNFMSLECDDIVVTRENAAAKVVWAQGKLALAPNSRIELMQIMKTQKNDVSMVNLAYGKLRVIFNHKEGGQNSKDKKEDTKNESEALNKTSNFRVKTHTAVAGVRGTDFFVGFDPLNLQTEQATLSGKVEVQSQESGQKVLVESGQQVRVEKPQTSELSGAKKETQNTELKVQPIQESMKSELRVASAIVKDDKEFTNAKAVQIIGLPQSWTLEKESVPSKFKDLKNEF